jgi:hypothetical protein
MCIKIYATTAAVCVLLPPGTAGGGRWLGRPRRDCARRARSCRSSPVSFAFVPGQPRQGGGGGGGGLRQQHVHRRVRVAVARNKHIECLSRSAATVAASVRIPLSPGIAHPKPWLGRQKPSASGMQRAWLPRSPRAHVAGQAHTCSCCRAVLSSLGRDRGSESEMQTALNMLGHGNRSDKAGSFECRPCVQHRRWRP